MSELYSENLLLIVEVIFCPKVDVSGMPIKASSESVVCEMSLKSPNQFIILAFKTNQVKRKIPPKTITPVIAPAIRPGNLSRAIKPARNPPNRNPIQQRKLFLH